MSNLKSKNLREMAISCDSCGFVAVSSHFPIKVTAMPNPSASNNLSKKILCFKFGYKSDLSDPIPLFWLTSVLEAASQSPILTTISSGYKDFTQCAAVTMWEQSINAPPQIYLKYFIIRLINQRFHSMLLFEH